MKYISEDTLNNIYDRHSNVFGIISNPDCLNNNDKCFGKITLLISITSNKNIIINDIVEFNKDKIKWRASRYDDKGCTVCLVDPYWCKIYEDNPKIKCPIRVLKSKVENGNRNYYSADDIMLLTKDQFIKKRLLIKFSKHQNLLIKAVENFNERYWSSKNYYKSLNETSKHFLIKHDQLKRVVSTYNNAKKEFNKEWNKLLLKHYQINQNDLSISKLLDNFKQKKETKIINFSRKP